MSLANTYKFIKIEYYEINDQSAKRTDGHCPLHRADPDDGGVAADDLW